MPRNSGGTYSLPAGNPVVTGTTVSSTWANSTLADIAAELTNSLARDGSGSMDEALLLPNGTAVAPSLAFASETTTGLYLEGAQDVRLQVNATNALKATSAGVTIPLGLTVTQDTPNGSAVTGTANGSGYGGDFNAASSSGAGVRGTGVGSGAGATFTGGVTGPGVTGSGGATGGTGVVGVGTGGAGVGVQGTGAGTGVGVSGTGGPTNAVGVVGTGTGLGIGVQGIGATNDTIAGDEKGSGVLGVGAAGTIGGRGVTGLGGSGRSGIYGIGGPTAGSGVFGVGGTTNGIGVIGQGTGTAAGGDFTGGASNGDGITSHGGGTGTSGVFGEGGTNGAGVWGVGGGPNGVGGVFIGSGTGHAVQVDTGHAKFTGANPASTVGFTNTLTPKNIIKAWGYITTNGAGAATMVDGFNVSSTIGITTAVLTITFTTPISANAAIVLTPTFVSGGPLTIAAHVGVKTASTFTVGLHKESGGSGQATVNLTTEQIGVSFIVMGAQ